jgi:hypothetical protein
MIGGDGALIVQGRGVSQRGNSGTQAERGESGFIGTLHLQSGGMSGFDAVRGGPMQTQ